MSFHPLARELVIILVIKAAIVLAAGIFVFGPKQRLNMNSKIVETRMLDGSDDLVVRTTRSPKK